MSEDRTLLQEEDTAGKVFIANPNNAHIFRTHVLLIVRTKRARTVSKCFARGTVMASHINQPNHATHVVLQSL